MIIAEIKIVGAITDENALEEIESIARIFAYEQRMKDYTPIYQSTYPSKKVKKLSEKQLGEQPKFIQSASSRILVKGLC